MLRRSGRSSSKMPGMVSGIMGQKNYLIEGSSGTGKTSVATELARRGYHVIHGDRTLSYVGDPETGAPLSGPPPGVDVAQWGYEHWIWPVERVKALLADTEHPVTFFCGGSRNFAQFAALFDRIFVLDLDAETLNRRLDGRPDEPGFAPDERAVVMRHRRNGAHVPAGIVIDTSGSVGEVVDAILAQLD